MTTDNQWASNDTAGHGVERLLPDADHGSGCTPRCPGIECVPDLADGELQPAVQEGDTWIGEVTLREGLMWSDGEPITAEDVAFTWQNGRHRALRRLADYTTAPDIGPITAVEAVDDLTVRVTFNAQPGLAVWGHGTGITNADPAPALLGAGRRGGACRG